MPQSLRATKDNWKTIDLFSTLRHWNLRNLTLQQECYLTSTRDFFRNTHGSIILPPRQPRVFARLGSLAINNSRHLARKYSRIFVREHYLFWEANSSLSEKCELRETDNVRGQISEHIFAPDGRLLSLSSRSPRAVLEIGEYSRRFPSFSWGIFGHLTCLDQSRASEKIWWITIRFSCKFEQ